MVNPSFMKVWDIASDFVQKLPSNLCDELHESLNRGIDILDSEPLLQMYIYSFGKMHNAKLQYAYNNIQKRILEFNHVEIVDYGCGQGLATICFHDFVLEHNSELKVKRIILIEPSVMALSRAELLCSRFYPETDIITINKNFDELTNEDLKLSSDIPTIHLLSNILDIESFNLSHFSQIVKEQSVGVNEYIIVSPMQNTQRLQRLKSFASTIDKNIYFEHYFDKRQIDKEKDWTCAVLLCSDSLHSYCDIVFDEALAFINNKGDVNQNLTGEQYEKLFNKLLVCAKSGDKRCQNQLGLWYEKGFGIKQDFQQALDWYRKSAEQKYPSAFGNIGNLYSIGKGVEKDSQKAFAFYFKGAELNHPYCQYKLGLFFLKGIGVEKDYNNAFIWLKRATDQGFAKAFYPLYLCYLYGLGTDRNEKTAIDVLKEAVNLNDPKSCYILADYCQSGKLVEKINDEKALELFTKSAELGYCSAQKKLGEIYWNGLLGQEKDPQKAFKWYYEAAKQGSDSAQFYVGLFYSNGYGVKKDLESAFNWYSQAAQQNNSAALNNLAVCYEYGKGTNIDLSKAISYYEQSAKMGNIKAQKNLATCFLNGTGVEPDPNKVFFWTYEAAKKSDFESLGKIAFFYFKGFGTNKNNEEALIWYSKYYSKATLCNQIKNSEDAINFFIAKADEGDTQALYIVGKCMQYGIATIKNIKNAHSYYEKAARLGHIESLIKVKRITSLYRFCSIQEDANSIKDPYGAIYSKDKKVLISLGIQQSKEYKIPTGTRIICDNAFYFGTADIITIPSSVVLIGKNPFVKNGWGGRKSIRIVCHSPNYIVSDFALFTQDKKKLVSYFGKDSKYTIPYGIETIGENAFYENENILDLRFPDTLHFIEDGAFMYCFNLQRIILPKSVTNIGSKSFYGCESLTEVLSLGDISMIKEETFMGCNISKLVLPESLVEIANDAFNSNYELQHLVLPNSVRKIGNSCFAYCDLKYISLSDNLQEIGDFCFFQCPIDTIIIPSQVNKIGINPFIGTLHIKCLDNNRFVSENGLLYNVEKGELIAHFEDAEIALYPPICRVKPFAFYNSKVTDIFMGANIVEIQPWAFYKAELLEKVIWQKCKIQIIPMGCFGECSKLNRIDIPSTVEDIQKGSLFDCYDLRVIRFYGTKTKANEEVFLREAPSFLPEEYWSPNTAMGSSVEECTERNNVDFNSFIKIEIIVPSGYSNILHFSAIYNHDLYNQHRDYGYGMDRQFIVKEYEKE